MLWGILEHLHGPDSPLVRQACHNALRGNVHSILAAAGLLEAVEVVAIVPLDLILQCTCLSDVIISVGGALQGILDGHFVIPCSRKLES